MDKFRWIRNHFEKRKDVYKWNSIKDILPNSFDEYFLIHWKVGIIEDFPFDNYPEQSETIEQINKRIQIEKDFNLFLNRNDETLFKEVNLNYISNRFNIELNHYILNKIKQTPAIRILEQKSKETLKASLKRFSRNETLYFFIEDVFRYPPNIEQKQEYFKISVEEYIEIQEELAFDFSTYLFPENMKWCLTTSEDLPMFICVKKEVSKKLKTFDLELFKIDYNKPIY